MSKLTLNTSQRIQHVYGCTGETMHVHPGQALLLTSRLTCPTCGAEVTDITNTPLGQAYFAFARPDLTKPTDTQTIRRNLQLEIQATQAELEKQPKVEAAAHLQWLKAKLNFYTSNHYQEYKRQNQ